MGYLNFTSSGEDENGEKIKINEMAITPSFWNGISFKKSNKEFGCRACDKWYGKGTRYIGDNYERVCMFCAKEWVNNSVIFLDKMKEKVKSLEPELKENFEKWSADCVMGEL